MSALAGSSKSAEYVAALASTFTRLAGSVLIKSLGTACCRLPLACLLCTTVTLAVSACLIWFEIGGFPATFGGQTLSGCLLATFFVAGLMWGVHRGLRAGVLKGLASFKADAPAALDQLLMPLTQAAEESCPRLAIRDVRQFLSASNVDQVLPAEFKWLRWLARIPAWFARWLLRAEIAAIEQALSAAESEGRRDISLEFLRRYASDQCTAKVVLAADLQLRQFDLAAAIAVFPVLVVPGAIFIFASV